MMSIKTLISSIFLVALTLPLFSQEQPLKDYAEDRRERKFCLYPSTLRMINIKQNEDFNRMVSGVEKLLIYTMDSTAKADKSYKGMISAYRELGYEEYIAMYGGGSTMYLYGNNEQRTSEFIGVFKQTDSDMAVAFYLRGNIGWDKIPDLIKSFNEDDMLNLLDFNTENFGNDPHN